MVFPGPQVAPAELAGEITDGRALLAEQRYSAAMNRFEAALRIEPHNRDAQKGETATAKAWALAEIRAGQPDAAMEVLTRALRVLPEEPELLQAFGIEATTLKAYGIAEQALRTADRLRPKDATTVYALARLEVEQGQLPQAERDLKAYLLLRPEDATAYFGLGHVYAMEQRTAEAKGAFERSVALKPEQTESFYQLGQIALEGHDDATAEAMFGKVLARAPQHAGALTGMGELALRAKEYAKAEQLLREAEQSDPAYATPHYFRGLALARLGRKEEAEAEMRRGDSRPHADKPIGAEPAASSPGTGGLPSPP